jgi:DNA-binding CsgD family transcriptional regulator
MRNEASEMLELVGKLHEGVVDPDSWRSGLDSVCDFVGTSLLLLGAINQSRRTLDHAVGHRMRSESFELISGPLANRVDNPWLAMLPDQPLRRPLTLGRLVSRPALERTRLWKEVYVPFRVSDSAGAMLERQPDLAEVVMIGRFQPHPEFSAAELNAFAAVLPHLARAWRVKRALAAWEARAGTLKYILDRLERAVVVAGPDGKVRFANRAADRLLSRGDGLDARHGRLHASRSYHDAALHSLIDRAARTGIGAGTAAVDAVSIPSAADGPTLAVVAEPLAPAHSDCLGHRADAGAILFIGDSIAASSPSAERLRVVYGLTRAEARLTSLIVEGRDIVAAAESLKVSTNTVKYHLKAIFGKVGVSRQSQLVRRVLADVGGLAEPDKLTPH